MHVSNPNLNAMSKDELIQCAHQYNINPNLSKEKLQEEINNYFTDNMNEFDKLFARYKELQENYAVCRNKTRKAREEYFANEDNQCAKRNYYIARRNETNAENSADIALGTAQMQAYTNMKIAASYVA